MSSIFDQRVTLESGAASSSARFNNRLHTFFPSDLTFYSLPIRTGLRPENVLNMVSLRLDVQ